MNTVGIGVDYSNICKDYNTMYLDRDNTDKETKTCMKSVVAWLDELLNELVKEFELNIYNMNSGAQVGVDTLAANRFLFYSLEKDITLQNFIVQKEFVQYNDLSDWDKNNQDGILIKNDEEGEGIYFYLKDESKIYPWLKDKLKGFTLDNVSLNIN